MVRTVAGLLLSVALIPLIRANDNRKHAVHIVVFFLFLVATVGGSFTSLGVPPLFLGFLKDVDFSSSLRNREEVYLPTLDPTPDSAIRFEGTANFFLLTAIVGLVLMSGLWKPGVTLSLFGIDIELQNLVRDALLIGVIFVSLAVTPQQARKGNEFSWCPTEEVAKLFAVIFITIIPVTAMLRAGEAGAFAPITCAVNDDSGQPINAMYFWASGILSSFLDNAPTYLVFFNTAGGDPVALMTSLAGTLTAISCGAVFMGANSYIGNAPNLMVKAIAEERGIRMPSFFGYMAWSCAVLVPLFILMTFIFFM